jgi:formylglycine-generating enzyme required for sulfatase activity
MSRIFLSHSSENNAEAVALRDWLVSHGWDDLFLDLDPERGLKAGERWQAALKKAAERCELVIFLVSPEWAASKWCLAEFLLARNLNKRIFGVIVKVTPLADLPMEMTVDWQLVDLTAGKRDYRATIPQPSSDQTTLVSFTKTGLDRLRIGLMEAGLDARYFAWPPEHDPCRAPYRGLQPLEAEDAGIFFGRDGPTVVGLDLLRGLREAAPPRLLVILGASGAGKSSFLRAGLLPRLARESQHFLPLPVIRPERAALTNESGLIASLEKALKEAGLGHTRAELRRVIEAGTASVASLLESLVNANTTAHTGDGMKARKSPTLVLAIDQAEELFRTEGAEEARAFLDLLRELVAHDSPALIASFTIRSDSYERLQTAENLQGLRQHMLSLPPMPKGAYAEVIKGPARRLEGTKRALKIEEPLVDALLSDIEGGGAKDALPLLAFTLERLYREYGGDGDLKLSEYEDLGRVKGSIEAAVERALRVADADPKIPRDREARLALLRRGLIPWLAGIDPDTGSPRRRIARQSEIPAESRPLIELLVEQRLLSTDVSKETSEVTIEPAHEALLRQWGLLQDWLAEDAGLLGVLDGAKRASRDWAANAKGAAWLTHRGERLKAAEQLAERPDLAANLETTDRDYLTACCQAERAATVRKRRIQVAIGGLILLVVAAGVGWWYQYNLLERWRWFTNVRPYMLTQVRPYVLTAEAEQALKPGHSFRECAKNCPEMIVIPVGQFMMGSPDNEMGRSNNEGPQHRVALAEPFAVSKFEVTFDDWDACVDHGDCEAGVSDGGWGRGRQPVISVTWDDAKRYVTWLSRMTGKPYRLLSEAEWEYAARAGAATRYSFGDDQSMLGEYAWYNGNSGSRAHPVGKKKPNAFGLYDMHGNVSEWVRDCPHDNYNGAPIDGSAWTSDECNERVVRDGSWYDDPSDLRSTVREGDTTANRTDNIGFRVARTLTARAGAITPDEH